MANGGDLQRILQASGASRIKLDSVMRELRAAGYVATEGRGPHARNLDSYDAARVLIAYLGTNKAVQAVQRLEALIDIKCARSGKALIERVQQLVSDTGSDGADFELRIARNSECAKIEWETGDREVYLSTEGEAERPQIRSEGVISGRAINKVALIINGPSPALRRSAKRKVQLGGRK